ncbi:MAG: asparaginase [Acidobacteriota bacterium]|jgi:L-asparaginase
MARGDHRPTILAVFTGGTISCTLDVDSGLPVPTLTGEQILERTPGLADVAGVVIDDFGRYPGPHMHPGRMLQLASRIRAATTDGAVDGVIVTHGTDAIEETAFMLDRVLDPEVPVIVFGAMKLVSDPTWDGPANVLAAAQVAAAPAARGRGTMVVMADSIHAAVDVVKVHAESYDSFASPQTGPLGVVDRGNVIFFAPPARSSLPSFAGDTIEENVDLIKTVAGADGRYVAASLAAGARGLVIEGMGRGNVTPGLAAAIKEAAADLPIVMTTRCLRGRAAPMYGYDGGAATLREHGVIFADHLPGPKARLLLMLLLGTGATRDEIRAAFEQDRY